MSGSLVCQNCPTKAKNPPWLATVQFSAYPFTYSDSRALFPCAFKTLTAFTGYFISPRKLIVFTASIASTAIGANKSSSLERNVECAGCSKNTVISLLADDLAGHRSLRNIDERLLPKMINLDAELVLHKFDCLSAS